MVALAEAAVRGAQVLREPQEARRELEGPVRRGRLGLVVCRRPWFQEQETPKVSEPRVPFEVLLRPGTRQGRALPRAPSMSALQKAIQQVAGREAERQWAPPAGEISKARQERLPAGRRLLAVEQEAEWRWERLGLGRLVHLVQAVLSVPGQEGELE